jgi:glycogen synthase
MNLLLLTNEYPPHIYGGAGVHVDYLTRAITSLTDNNLNLRVLCFGDQQADSASRLPGDAGGVHRIAGSEHCLPAGMEHPKILDTLFRNIVMTGSAGQADVVHCHTWYTFLAGCLIRQTLQIPLVLTIHSLEPHRPWKQEQLANGYFASRWLEQTAVQNADGIIAVSQSMKSDVQSLYGADPGKVRVIYNGIDTDQYRKVDNPQILSAYGIDPHQPYVLFVGRITRQKGIIHLVRALRHLDPGIQVVLCAGAPDTADIGREMQDRVARTRSATPNPIVWISEMVPRDELIAIYSHAAVFVCPSVYEPFGLINVEAMACGTPVVASAVGGIREVVVHEKTGLLVPFEPAGASDPEPRDPARFARVLADAINDLMRSPEKRRAMGRACRQRVEAHFSWHRIARQTVDFYRERVDLHQSK